MSQSRKRLVVMLAALAAGFGAIVVVARPFTSHARAKRPELQRVLDRLVTAPNRRTPGATAYVIGPKGTWSGSAGVANLGTVERMRADERLRIDSNSKIYVLAVALQLVREQKLRLDDTVERWFPGLLHANGDKITVRELMTDSSGLIDDNDVTRPGAFPKMLANVHDPELRATLASLAARFAKGPVVYAPPMPMIELAGWQPLLFAPGTQYHHGNIGWNLAGLIVAKAAGKPLPDVYRERIFEPLGLKDTAYDPQGPIRGSHARGYALYAGGRTVDRTNDHAFTGADGAIVTTAHDEATFARALWDGTLVDRRDLLAFYGPAAGQSGCAANVTETAGTSGGFRSFVWSDRDGKRFAVLLVNGNRVDSPDLDPVVEAASRQLYCAA